MDEEKRMACCDEDGVRLVLSIDPEREELLLEGAGAEVELQLTSGEWIALKREGNRYEIPKTPKASLICTVLLYRGFPLHQYGR